MDFSNKLKDAGISSNHHWTITCAFKALHQAINTVSQKDNEILLSRTLESWMDELIEIENLRKIEWKDFKTQMVLAMEKELKAKKEPEPEDLS